MSYLGWIDGYRTTNGWSKLPATILSIQRFTLFRVSHCCFNSEGSKLPLNHIRLKPIDLHVHGWSYTKEIREDYPWNWALRHKNTLWFSAQLERNICQHGNLPFIEMTMTNEFETRKDYHYYSLSRPGPWNKSMNLNFIFPTKYFRHPQKVV